MCVRASARASVRKGEGGAKSMAVNTDFWFLSGGAFLRNVDVQIQVRDRSEGGYQLLHKIRQRGIIHMYPRKLLVVDFICGFWWEFEDALFPIWYVTELLVVDAAFALLGAIDARPVAVLAETEAFFTEKSAALIGRGDVIRSV